VNEGNFAHQAACEVFHDYSFISIETGADLSLINVKFVGFRQQFSSIISLTNATLSLTNVNFTNIYTTQAVIVQTDPSLTDIFQLMNVSVGLLNNGYEYVSGATYAGFLSVQGALQISIQNSSFAYSVVGVAGSLISVHDFITFSIANCQFSYILGRIVHIVSSVQLPLDLDSSNTFLYQPLTHISIATSNFTGISANSLISLSLQADLLNIEIKGCRFESDLSLTSGLINLSYTHFVSQKEISGGFLAVLTDFSRVRVYFPPKWVNITDNSLIFCSLFGNGLIFISNFANVKIAQLSILSSGDFSPFQTLNDLTLKKIASFPTAYMSRPVSGLPFPSCFSLVYLQSIYGLLFHYSKFESNTCTNGQSGLIGVNISNKVDFQHISMGKSSSNSMKFASSMDLSFLGPALFQFLTIFENMNTASNGTGVVRVTGTSTQVLNSQFRSNTMPIGGALQCVGTCYIENSVFEGNAAKGASAAGVVYSPLPNYSEFTLLKVTFRYNLSVLGAALTITDTNGQPIQTHLTITNSQFESNTALRLGSCIHLTSSVTLSAASTVSDSLFRNNTAPQGCVYNSFLSGVLVFDQCLFQANRGAGYAVLYSESPASSVSSRLSLHNTRIESNTGTMCIAYYNIDSFTEGGSHNLTFQHNSCRGFYLQWTRWNDSDSLFFNNTSPDVGAAFSLLYLSQFQTRNSRFVGNTARIVGGAMYFAALSSVLVQNATFVNNTCNDGGAVFLDQQAVLVVNNSKFEGNVAYADGSAIKFSASSIYVPSFVLNCIFLHNHANSGTISAIASNVTITGCEIYENTASEYPGIVAFLSHIAVIQTKMHHQTASKGTFIAGPAASVIVIEKCLFEQGQAQDRGVVYTGTSTLLIKGSVFQDIKGNVGSVVSVVSTSTLRMEDCRVERVSTKGAKGGAVLISESSSFIAFSQFREFSNGAVVSLGSALEVSDCRFAEGSSSEGAGVYCSECPSFSITRSACTSLTAISAACLSLSATAAVAPYEIRSCDIRGNRGNHTGAVLADSVDLKVANTVFSNNSAFENAGSGGAISLLCDQIYCNVSVIDSIFEYNSAGQNGGAILWTRYKPAIVNVTFSGNSAKYGDDIASFPIKLAFTSHLLSNLTGIPSGQPAAINISVALFDHYGQIVTTDNYSPADLFPVFNQNTTVAGVTRVLSNQGLFMFSSYEITYAPGADTQIKVVTTGIDPAKTETGVLVSQELVLDVSMRPCLIGESQLSNLCYPCPEGKYSLDPSDSCQDCPTGAVCVGRAEMVPKSGYWRSKPTSDVFWECPNSDACLGSKMTGLVSLTGECAEGYYGNMCNGCLSGFSRSSRTKCGKCPDQAVNIVRSVGIGLAMVLVIAFVIKMSLISAHKARSHYSVYLKIFVNYIQLVTVTATFELSWPSYALQLFNIQEQAGNISEQIFSFDCFRDSGETDNQRQVVFLKVVIVSLVPLLIVAVSFCFWTLVCCCRSSWYYLKYELVNSLVVMFFMVHPSIIKLMFDFFNCKQIDTGEYWLTSFLNIRCWDTLHYRYAMAVALPSIILWGILTPSTALMLLIRYRKHLDDLNVKVRFGFLYTGYLAQKYYWEFVILYRKVLIIVFAVFFTNISIPVQALCVMLVLLVAFILQMQKNPYLTPTLNDLELRAVLVGTLTIYCGLFFLTSGIDASTKMALFCIILLANVYFLVYWLVKTCKAGCELFLSWLPKVRNLLFFLSSSPIAPTRFPGFPSASQGAAIAPNQLLNISRDLSVSMSKVKTR